MSRPEPGSRSKARVLLGRIGWAFNIVVFTILGVALLVMAMNKWSSWKLVLNTTTSMPLGVYLVREGTLPTHDGQIVVVHYKAPGWALKEKITGQREMFIKKIGALPGDHIVEQGRDILRCPSGTAPASACKKLGERVVQNFDGLTFPTVYLPSPVPAGKVYLTSESPMGFDSRYLGYFELSSVQGVAWPVLTY